MIDRTEACFDLKPKRLAADTAYGTGKFLGWLVKEKKITPHIPVWDKSERDDGTFSRSDFNWDKKRRLHLPERKGAPDQRYRARRAHSALPRLQARLRCLSAQGRSAAQKQARKIPRDLHEDARDVARRKMKTKAFLKSRDQRKRVEMRFAHLKTHHGFERLRLRGLSGARDEFHLAAIVQNLKTLALRLIRPPPPSPRMRELRGVSAGGVGCVSVEADARIGRGQERRSVLFLQAQQSAQPRNSRRRLFRQHRPN